MTISTIFLWEFFSSFSVCMRLMPRRLVKLSKFIFFQINIYSISFCLHIFYIHRTAQQRLNGSAVFFRELFHENKQTIFLFVNFNIFSSLFLTFWFRRVLSQSKKSYTPLLRNWIKAPQPLDSSSEMKLRALWGAMNEWKKYPRCVWKAYSPFSCCAMFVAFWRALLVGSSEYLVLLVKHLFRLLRSRSIIYWASSMML